MKHLDHVETFGVYAEHNRKSLKGLKWEKYRKLMICNDPSGGSAQDIWKGDVVGWAVSEEVLQ